MIYIVCKPEADQNKITDEQFGRAMAGDAIEHATGAFLEELVDFFPEAKCQVLRKALEKYKKAQSLAIEIMNKRLDNLEMEKQVESVLRNTSDSSGSLPESQA